MHPRTSALQPPTHLPVNSDGESHSQVASASLNCRLESYILATSMAARPVDMVFPKSWAEFKRMPQLQTADILYHGLGGYRMVYRLAPGVIMKHGGEFGDEILCMRAAQAAGLPVPSIIHHPGVIDGVR